MTGISITFDKGVPNDVQRTIQGFVNSINLNPTLARDVSVTVTVNIDSLRTRNREDAKLSANFTGTTKVPNDTIFVNQEFDYAPYATTQVQSLMHELVHVNFPNVAKGTIAHSEAFYEKLAVISAQVGVPVAGSDLMKWADHLRARGVTEDVITETISHYAKDNPRYGDNPNIGQMRCFSRTRKSRWRMGPANRFKTSRSATAFCRSILMTIWAEVR